MDWSGRGVGRGYEREGGREGGTKLARQHEPPEPVEERVPEPHAALSGDRAKGRISRGESAAAGGAGKGTNYEATRDRAEVDAVAVRVRRRGPAQQD
jgi:hypothetical protein